MAEKLPVWIRNEMAEELQFQFSEETFRMNKKTSIRIANVFFKKLNKYYKELKENADYSKEWRNDELKEVFDLWVE